MLGYIFRYQLFVYSCNSCLYVHTCWFRLSFSCLFIMLFSYLMYADYILVVIQLFIYHVIYLSSVCSLSCYYSVHIVYMHEHSSLHTHSPGRFLTTLDLYVQILNALFLLFRCSMRTYTSRGAKASLYLIPVFLSFLLSCYLLILDISDLVVISILYLYDIMRGCLYVILK